MLSPRLLFLAGSFTLASMLPAPASAQPARVTPTNDPFASLTPTSVLRGFRAAAVYLDAADRPIGARFVHEKSGFTLDLARQQSVPQAYIWVNTFPMTDRGEPHTQEHLLVGKGSKGRALGTVESASLATSTAFTQQWRTGYQFNTSAGAKAFYSLLDTELDALLNPDFTDEEIRREVRNFGISEDRSTRALSLEEKGSVYNEMTSSTSTPFSRMYRELTGMVYGREHPLARNSGGMPEGIREMKAEDIRAFHREHYYLANMGMVVAVPDAMTLDDVLANIGRTLVKYDRAPAARAAVRTPADLPAPVQAPEGTVRIASFPHRNAQQPGPVLLAWPATRQLTVDEQTLMSLFLESVAGDPTTNLYKLFVDSRTRTVDVGAKQVIAFSNDEPGNPIYLGLNGVEPSHMTEAEIVAVRSAVLAELRRIAALPDASPELVELNNRVKSRILSTRRGLSKFVNSPPGFGFRTTGGEWLAQLDRVNRVPGFRKSLVLASAMRAADSVVNLPVNPWRTLLPKWQLTTVTPFASAARPDPTLMDREDAERRARAAAEVARLRAAYAVTDDQEAIRRYKAEYDRNSAELDRLAAAVPRTKLVDDLPMTLDDQLRYAVDSVRGVPVVSSTFESMTSMTAGLALRLDGVPDDDLVYVAALPALLTRVGIVKNGTPMSFEAMSERQRREILSLAATFATNARTGRVELVLRGAGNDQAEAIRALGWMQDVLTAPDWRPENLARIRDLVDQTLTALRNTQQGAPEGWVQGVAGSYRRQGDARYLTAASFLTRTHYLLRLRWLLKDAGDDVTRRAIDGWMMQLAGAAQGADRASIQAMLKAIVDTAAAAPTSLAGPVTAARGLPPGARTLAVDAARDLQLTLADVPDTSLGADWMYLVNTMRQDLLVAPAAALASLDAVRTKLLTTGNARAFVISSSATRRAVAPGLSALIGTLRAAPRATVTATAERRVIDDRLRTRTDAGTKPEFVGLLDQNMQGGVAMFSIPSVTYTDTSRRTLTRFLASKLYAGGGAHSMFSQTIAAGLAYSNGIGGSPTNARLTYYAERTPEIPQTVQFVVDQLKKSPHDTSLVDYAMALVFAETRSGADFESRGEGMANDLADAQTPESVRRFRQRLLALRRSTPALGRALYAQMDSVYAELFPGYFKGMKAPGAVYFTIGAEKQMSAYEKYLNATVSPDAKLFRLYPRDFWVTSDRRTTVP